MLFADIVGFTTLSERLDPEDVRELSASVLARLAEAVALYGGTIDKFMGDAIMALFGAPVAHEDDPVRAVRAALTMHQAVAALGQLDRDGNELELRLRIGINSGQVIAGVRDVGGHREYSVFGDVVNTAARLQTAAEPGGVLLGEETARQAGSVFDVAAVEPLMLKGKAQPVPAYEVRGSLAREVPALGAGPAGGKRPLVGRLGELREVRRQLQDLSTGRGGLVAIIGEHGVGKSRLLAEAREHGERAWPALGRGDGAVARPGPELPPDPRDPDPAARSTARHLGCAAGGGARRAADAPGPGRASGAARAGAGRRVRHRGDGRPDGAADPVAGGRRDPAAARRGARATGRWCWCSTRSSGPIPARSTSWSS